MGYYNNDNWSNYLFISDPEDLKKELKYEDIGKEIFCLAKHAFCETCNKTLKAFSSSDAGEDKARALVQKHLGYKKNAGHKASVKTIVFPDLKKCTTADIIGTKANTDRNDALRETFFSGTRSKIEQEIASHETTIEKVQRAFKLTERLEDNIPKCPKELQDGTINLRSDNGRVYAVIKADDFKSIEELFAGTWGRNDDYDKNCYQRASMLIHYIDLKGEYSSEKIYKWDYPIVYDDFVGFDKSVGECAFCHKEVENWNDAYEGDWNRNYVHRECFKHFKEQGALETYAEKYAEKLVEDEKHAKWEKEFEERQKKREAEQEVTNS